ncbi:MAG: hypothetical protein ACLTXM_12135 [Enterococcus sp.]
MKRTKKQVLSMITVGYLLLNSLVLSGTVFAETVPSEEVKTTSTSSPTSESLSSSLPNIPAPAISSSEPTVSSEAKKAARILSYEDNQLLEVAKADSARPAIVFQKKELENGLTIQGTVSAGSEENQSETVLSALILQRQAENGEWQKVHPFSIDEKGVNLTETNFPFDYSEGLEDIDEANYRLAADYEINYSDEDEQAQKGSFDIGTVFKVEKQESEEHTEESSSTAQESTDNVHESTTESTQDSTESTTEKLTVVNSEPKEDLKQSEPIMVDPFESKRTSIPSTLENNTQIPKMQDNYREAFSRGLGIMPLASNILTSANYSENEQLIQYNNSAQVNHPKVYEAKYTSKTTVDVTFEYKWRVLVYSHQNFPSGGDYITPARNGKYSFNLGFHGTNWQTPYIQGDRNYSAKGNLTLDQLEKTPSTGLSFASFDSTSTLDAQRWGEGNTKLNVWADNNTKFKFSNLPTNQSFQITYSVGVPAGDHHSSSSKTIMFNTAQVSDLTYVSIPKFTATDERTTSVDMNQGSYTGDTYSNGHDGVLQLSDNGGGGWSNHITNLEYTETSTTPAKGTYSARNLTGLTPGTEYRGRVAIKDWLGNSQYSKYKDTNENIFFTPNSVNAPNVPESEMGTPTNANNATARVTATYNVGPTPAHPNEVETQIWDASLNKWITVDSSPKINSSTRTINYELKGLPSNTLCYTQYRVKNASKAWSPWASCSFHTKGVKLAVSKPVMNDALTGTNEATFYSGTYTGDVKSANAGEVWYYDGSGWFKYSTTLGHESTTNGSYAGSKIDNLSVGTNYQLQVGLIDTTGTVVYAAQGFDTLNTVEKPVIDSIPTPTGKHNASANITGVYGVGPAGKTPAHPDRVEVQISMDGGSTWQNVNGSSTPKLDSQSIITAGTKANFTINKMKANTEYQVRYRVKNGDPNKATFGWSAWSDSSDIFRTPLGPASMELINAPKFDFGMLKNENFPQMATLDAASTKNHVELENTILASGWKLTAKLDQLKRTDNPSIVMPWATLSMDINLQKSPDDGVSWSNYATGVSGSPGPFTINSGAPASTLWSIANPNDAQGLFRTEIDWSKVKLNVPANQTGMYQGNLVWSLDDTP